MRPAPPIGKAQSRPPPPPPAGAATPPLPPVAATPRRVSDRPPPEDGWSDTPTLEHRSARLSEEMRGEVRAIARVAVDEALVPLVNQLKELTAALERERRERAEGDARALQSAASVAKKTTLPGVAEAPAAAALVPAIAAPTPPPPSVVAPSVVAELVTTPTAPRVMPGSQPPPAMTSQLAPVIVRRAPDLVIDSGPLYVELPGMLDGARRRKRNAWLVTLLLLVIMGGTLAAMLISQSQPR